LTVLLVIGTMMLPPGIVFADTSGPQPHGSSPDYNVGTWNTTYSDPYSNTVNATVFYPATLEGDQTPAATIGAPFPVLGFLHNRGIRPPYTYYGSYGEHLAARGFVVVMPELDDHDGVATQNHTRMAGSALAALAFVTAQNGTSSSTKAALMAAEMDGGANVSAVACLALDDSTAAGNPSAIPGVGSLEMPLHLQGGEVDRLADHDDWGDAFRTKAKGYVSIMVISGANHVQYQDGPHPADRGALDGQASISREEQHNRSNHYILAFLDRHLKNDVFSESKLYGAEAAADVSVGLLVHWEYGVLDEEIEFTRPAQGSTLPSGWIPICATVTNVGVFPMLPRNCTLEVARMTDPGTRALISVFKENRTTTALSAGGRTELSWLVPLTVYGDYLAFLDMGDPDHNSSNNKDILGFTISPLEPPRIRHSPPETIELGQPFELVANVTATSGIERVWVNYTDELGLNREVPMTYNGTTGIWSVSLPAPIAIGEVTYAIHALARNGAGNATLRRLVPVVDNTAPVIEHELPPDGLLVMSEVDLMARVNDAGAVEQVKLEYLEPTTGYHNVTCGFDGQKWFHPVSIGPNEGVLSYTWHASDSWGNLASLGPFELTVSDGGPPRIEVVEPGLVEMGDDLELAATITDDAQITRVWVLYTLPGSVDEVNATAILRGSLWRMFIPVVPTPGTLVYEWRAVDINGYENSSGRLTVSVEDSQPPTIVSIRIQDTLVGSEPLVEVEIEDLGGVDMVLLEYTGVDGQDAIITMVEMFEGIWQAMLPLQTRGGEVRYSVRATDLVGNEASSPERTHVIQDVNPPVLVHVPPEDPVHGEPLELIVLATDDAGVGSVVLLLKLSPQGSFQLIELMEAEPGVYSYTIEGADVDPPEIAYYFEAKDMPPSINVALDPEDAPNRLYRVGIASGRVALFGLVKDLDGTPIAGAEVSIAGTNLSTTTLSDGTYHMDDIEIGNYDVVVDAEDYQAQTVSVVLTILGDVEWNFTLSPDVEVDGDESPSWFMWGISLLLIVAAVALIAVYGVLKRRHRG
jgi:hypothetical protein